MAGGVLGSTDEDGRVVGSAVGRGLALASADGRAEAEAAAAAPNVPPPPVRRARTIAANAMASRAIRMACAGTARDRKAGTVTWIRPWSSTTGVVRASGLGSVAARSWAIGRAARAAS